MCSVLGQKSARVELFFPAFSASEVSERLLGPARAGSAGPDAGPAASSSRNCYGFRVFLRGCCSLSVSAAAGPDEPDSLSIVAPSAPAIIHRRPPLSAVPSALPSSWIIAADIVGLHWVAQVETPQ